MNRLVTAELQKMKKMPIFDHFPRPGEIDPYGNQVIAVQSNDSDVTVTTNPHHELALCCMIHPRCKYIRESSILPSAMG